MPRSTNKDINVNLKILNQAVTTRHLNDIKNIFSREIHDDFQLYVAEECIKIYNEKTDKDETIYVPQFCFIEFGDSKKIIIKNSPNKGYAITFGLVVGNMVRSTKSINCGLHISFFRPYLNYPSDEILDEYNRISKIIEQSQESNYKNINCELPI